MVVHVLVIVGDAVRVVVVVAVPIFDREALVEGVDNIVVVGVEEDVIDNMLDLLRVKVEVGGVVAVALLVKVSETLDDDVEGGVVVRVPDLVFDRVGGCVQV